MEQQYSAILFITQLAVLASLLGLNLFAEQMSKRTDWGFVAWACCLAVLALCTYTEFLGILSGFSGGFALLSACLLAEAYARSQKLRGLK